jgi:shikimate dehydrogenase
MDSMGFSGAIVAAPHQLACRQFLMSESPECTKLGEVDLIHRESNGFVGANTTYRAACELLASKGPLLDKRAVVFGSGSDARAVALALSQSGVAMLTVVAADDGDEERIGTMVRDHTDCPLDLQLWAGMYRVPGDTDIVVQTTSSVDLDLNPSLSIDWAGITPAMLLLDTTYEYGSPQTEFVRLGTNAGAQCISGIDLFVQRSVAAFRLWTMLEPDALVMRDAIEEFMLV